MKRSFDFLGPECAGTNGDRVFVVPVAIEWSTSYKTGTSTAPDAILKASLQIELYNADLDIDLAGSGIVTVNNGIKYKDDLISFLQENRDSLLGGFPCFIGGEHSITPWILEGLRLSNIGIVWIDAHADLRESYQNEKESHACAARNALRFGDLVEIGVRSYSSDEKRFMSESPGVSVFRRFDQAAEKAVEELPDRVYISLDYDALDPSLVRAVGTPEPDGLDWNELMNLLDFVFREKEIIAMDAVELCPVETDEASNFIAAKIIYEAVSRHLKEGASNEK